MPSPLAPSRRRPLLRAALLAVLCAAIPAAPAQAGRLLVSGYDPEHHCGRNQVQPARQCNFVRVGIGYVRAGAPDATKPLLILDRTNGAPDFVTGQPREPDFVNAIARAFPEGGVAYEVVDPRAPQFASVPLTTDRYSAILVASSTENEPDDRFPQDLNEVGSTPDTDAINARATDIRRFFDAGGGLFVGSGGAAARSGGGAGYYRFLPITAATFIRQAPFALGPAGVQLGLLDDRRDTSDINSTYAHVAFEPPAGDTRLQPAVTDANGRAVVLLADVPRLAVIAEPRTTAAVVGRPLPSSRRCRSSARLRVVLARPDGVTFTSVTVQVNGREVRRVLRAQLGTGSRTRPFNVRLRRGRTSRVKVVVRTGSDRFISIDRAYRLCR